MICEEDHDGEWDNGNLVSGTGCYDGFMSWEEWKSHFEGYCGEGSPMPRDRYYMPLPVWMGENAYFNGAKPCVLEENPMVDTEHEIRVELKNENGTYRIVSNYSEYLPEVGMITSDTLGMAFEPEQRFETPDGEDIVFDTDYDGKLREGALIAGPFAGPRTEG